jgi:hypothetical protein
MEQLGAEVESSRRTHSATHVNDGFMKELKSLSLGPLAAEKQLDALGKPGKPKCVQDYVCLASG